ncbi:MAG: O-methyltransferase [Anaerolineales bacterium]
MADLKDTYIQILDYLHGSMEDDPVYEWILAEMTRRGFPQIQITPLQGRFLHLLVELIGARHILEVGTLGGYSTIWMATALPAEGKLVTLEADEGHAALAREALARAGVDDKVEVMVGPALNTMAGLALERPLDMVFIDADKPNNINYFKWAARRMRSGGLILVDNVLMNGRVVTDRSSKYMRSIDAFNQYVFDNYDGKVNVIPFYKKHEDNLDGIMIVQIK